MTKLTVMFVVVAGLVACGKKDDKPAATSGSAAAPAGDKAPTGGGGGTAGDCLVGTWERDDAGVKKQMVFNADKTGHDDKGDGTKSNFKWTIKDDKTVHVSYLAEGDSVGGEFDMPYNCAAGTFYSLYTKKP